MAFDYFYAQKVDVAVIEVGLGGRLDSTNIITPELSVITNISLDHTAFTQRFTREDCTRKSGNHQAFHSGNHWRDTSPDLHNLRWESR